MKAAKAAERDSKTKEEGADEATEGVYRGQESQGEPKEGGKSYYTFNLYYVN